LKDTRITNGLPIVYLYVIAFLDGFHQISVVVPHEGSSSLVSDDEHELVHIHYFAFDVDLPHAIANLIYPHLVITLGRATGQLPLTSSIVPRLPFNTHNRISCYVIFSVSPHGMQSDLRRKSSRTSRSKCPVRADSR